MDEDGMVQLATAANVAHRARVSLEDAASALKTLEEPEPTTATPEDDGRRIERVPGGWLVLNARKYREMATRELARASNRARVARHRERQRNGSVTGGNADATPESRSVMQSDTDTDTEGSPSESQAGTSRKKGTATRLDPAFALTPERRAIAIREGIDPDRTFLAFKNFWLAKGGSNARKVDWDRTWENWCMRDADERTKAGRGAVAARPSAAERVQRATGVKLK